MKIGKEKPQLSTFNSRNALTLPAPAKGRTFYKSADGPTGFKLMVTETGHCTYYLQYKPRGGGSPRWAKIGRAGEVSYNGAHDKAEELRGLVANFKDPIRDEREDRARKAATRSVLLRECITHFLAANHQHLDPKTVQAYEQTPDALPRSLMDAPAELVTPATFREAVRQATRAPIMQNRYLARLKAVLRFAHSEQKIRQLPAIVGMKKPNVEKRRDRVLTANEINALWRAGRVRCSFPSPGGRRLQGRGSAHAPPRYPPGRDIRCQVARIRPRGKRPSFRGRRRGPVHVVHPGRPPEGRAWQEGAAARAPAAGDSGGPEAAPGSHRRQRPVHRRARALSRPEVGHEQHGGVRTCEGVGDRELDAPRPSFSFR
jgi:hypothetical protein